MKGSPQKRDKREDSLGTDKTLGKVSILCSQRRGVNRRMSLQKLQRL